VSRLPAVRCSSKPATAISASDRSGSSPQKMSGGSSSASKSTGLRTKSSCRRDRPLPAQRYPLRQAVLVLPLPSPPPGSNSLQPTHQPGSQICPL
jgi:hypothetical protein